MANVNTFLQQVGAGTNLKDYKHATRLFVDSNYRLAPKYGFLYHVAFDLNPNLNKLTNEAILETGMLVKSAQLPKFTVDTKTFNAYNRPNIVQTKVKYDPITITFHDDSADIIRYFWWNYYSHYYRDSDHSPNDFAIPSKYANRQSQSWGYTPASYATADGAVERMLNAIRIYSLHQRKFTEYTLVNPTITGFKFGDHNSSGTELMEIQMTVAYEAVLYSYGQVNPGQTVNGFATLHYDKTPSPLTPQGGGTQSILGPGGLIAALDGVDHQLGQGNWLGAGLTAFKSFNNFKGVNWKDMASSELKTIGMNVLTGNNPLAKVQIPSFGGAPNTGSNTFGLAGGASALLMGMSRAGAPYQGSQNTAALGGGVQLNGFAGGYDMFGSPQSVTSNGEAVSGGFSVDPATGQRVISYDFRGLSLETRGRVFAQAKENGMSDIEAENYANSVAMNATTNALNNLNLNSSSGSANQTESVAQSFPVSEQGSIETIDEGTTE